MKKGYIKCPFCANEIKKGAIKCQFCEEFLDGREDAKNLIKSAKKGFWYRFFRKDLNLNKKRFHRLFKIIFFILLLFFPLKWTENTLNELSDYYWMEYVDTVKNRIGNDVVTVGSILKGGEYIDHHYSNNEGLLQSSDGGVKVGELTQYYIDFGFDSIEKTYEKLYCSNQRDTDKLLSLTKQTNLWYRSLSDGRRGQPNLGQVLNEIGDYKCVSIDTVYGEKFLNHQFVSVGDLYIVKSTAKSKWYGFWWRFGEHYLLYQVLVLVPGFLIILIYYKIIIYIIYGSYKKDK